MGMYFIDIKNLGMEPWAPSDNWRVREFLIITVDGIHTAMPESHHALVF
jgi:hypothetical protein